MMWFLLKTINRTLSAIFCSFDIKDWSCITIINRKWIYYLKMFMIIRHHHARIIILLHQKWETYDRMFFYFDLYTHSTFYPARKQNNVAVVLIIVNEIYSGFYEFYIGSCTMPCVLRLMVFLHLIQLDVF